MKMLVAVALVATSGPVAVTAAAASSGNENVASERRLCTQAARGRAGSRMAPRRICRTAAQWQAALGPDWRQHVSGRYLEDDMDSLEARTSPVGESIGQQGVPFSATRARGPQ